MLNQTLVCPERVKRFKMSAKFIDKFSMIYNKETIDNFVKNKSEQELDEFSDAHSEEHLLNLMSMFPPPYLYEIYNVYNIDKKKG